MLRCGRDGHRIRNRYACRPDRTPAIADPQPSWRLGRSLAHQAAGRHDLHHPRRQRRTRLSLADPAGALVESFYLLLSYTDVLVLQQFRPSEEVGVYFAVVKTLALVSFIHYAMAATTAHRFAEYHAQGDKDRLSAYVTHAIQWTFWPSLAATIVLLAMGKPLLWLFGPHFVVGYDIMFIAAIGLVVRSAIGPVERLLNMLGHQHICALAYALAFVMNVVLCIALVPRFGGHGAAAATSIALAFETVLLFWIVRRRLGLHVPAFGRARPEARYGFLKARIRSVAPPGPSVHYLQRNRPRAPCLS
jgi:Na+-driven multidrug efflux pump